MKRLRCLLISALIFCAMMPVNVHAEGDEDYSNTTYWNNLCTSTDTLSAADQQRCTAYLQYMKSQNSELQAKIDSINEQKSTITSNMSDLATQISDYNTQLSSLNAMISDLNSQLASIDEQIAEKEQEIADNQVQIAAKTDEVNELKTKLKNRMVSEQSTMHVSNYLDLLMGAKSFDELLRIVNCLSDINQTDTSALSQLNDSINELNTMQDQLKTDQETLRQSETDLNTGKSALASQQASLLATKYQLDLMQKQYKTELASANTELSSALAAAGSSHSGTSDSSSSSSSDSSGSADSSSSGSSSQTSGSGDNPYYGGWSNCTWGAWQLVYDTLGISLPRWGNAGEWLANAAASGYATGSSPAVYSIAVYSWHVAFVTAINGDYVYIKEGNYLGSYGERWVPASGLTYSGQNCLGYIYLN